MARPNGARRGKQIMLWMDPELIAAIDAARGDELDRAAWIRRACEQSLRYPERPLFARTTPAPEVGILTDDTPMCACGHTAYWHQEPNGTGSCEGDPDCECKAFTAPASAAPRAGRW